MSNMLKRFIWLTLAAAIAGTTLSACGGGSGSGGGSATDLVAKKQAPASLAGDDAAWSGASVTTIKTTVIEGSKAKAPVEVKAQALYSGEDIWFRFEWPDATETSNRLWEYDGTKWAKLNNEDRLGLYWEITPIEKFQTRGCTTLCHNPESDTIDKWYMIAPTADGLADNWHWKAARTNAIGQSDDKYLTGVLEDPKDIETANHGDKKDSGGYVDNVTKDGTGPEKMLDPSKKASLGSPFILVSEAVTLDVASLKAGDKIARELLAPWVGSRGDIESKGVYASGKWTVVMHRKLDTGHDDDIKLVPGKTYPFGLSVFDNTDGVNHTVSPDVLLLKFK